MYNWGIGEFMKMLILLMLVTLVACESEDNSDPYLSEVGTIAKLWTVQSQGAGVSFDTIDNSNPASITLTNVEKNGLFSNCTYSATYVVHNKFYGTYFFDSLTSGDAVICGQFSAVGYNAVHNSRLGRDVVSFDGKSVI